MTKPILINFESSCDACGKETISKRIKEILEAHGKKVLLTDFPRYGEYSGSLIERHLKHDAIGIKNSELFEGGLDGTIFFEDGTKKSTDEFLTKDELQKIERVEFDSIQIDSAIASGLCPHYIGTIWIKGDLTHRLVISENGKVLCSRLDIIDKIYRDEHRRYIDHAIAMADNYYNNAVKECLFVPGSKPSHLTRSLLYSVDRDIWFSNRPTIFTEKSDYDVILSDRSYMSNIIYRTVDMDLVQFNMYLFMTYITEIQASKIDLLPAANVHNVILTHDSFDFNKQVILNRAKKSGEKLDFNERDFTYQENLFAYAATVNDRVSNCQEMAKEIFEEIDYTKEGKLYSNFVTSPHIYNYFLSDTIKVSDGNTWRSTDYVAETIARKYVLEK